MSADTILLLMGESGSGKTTIADILEECYGLTQIRSYTTRPKRTPDEDCHTFVTKEQFHSLKQRVSYTEFNGYEYCCTQEQVQNNSVFVVDPSGINYFKSHYSGMKRPVVAYIRTKPETRFVRMVHRGDTTEQARERIKHDMSAFRDAESMADIIIDNDGDIADSVQKLLDYFGLGIKKRTNERDDM